MTEISYQQELEELVLDLAHRLKNRLNYDEKAGPGDRAALLQADMLLAKIYASRNASGAFQKISS
jgi:hypothetical protein